MPGPEAGMNWPSKAGEDSGGWPSVLVRRRLPCGMGSEGDEGGPWGSRFELRGNEEPSYVLDLKLVLGFRNTDWALG